MAQDRRAPSMDDVAAVAGVSHQTVSRVLNAHPSVRPETRQRVLEAVRQLGYRRTNAARALVTRRLLRQAVPKALADSGVDQQLRGNAAAYSAGGR